MKQTESEVDLSTVGARLKEARLAKDLTHRALSKLCPLPPKPDQPERWVGARHIGMIESGDRENLTTEIIAALCTALDCTADWLLFRKGVPPPGVQGGKKGAA